MANFRRTWDKQEFQLKAVKREQSENESKNKVKEATKELLKKDLKLRTKPVLIGKTFIKNSSSISNNFNCDLCKKTCNDSSSFILHLNSKYHQKNLGRNTNNIERSSLKQVQEKFKQLKRKNEDPLKTYKSQQSKNTSNKEQYEELEDDEFKMMRETMGFKSFSSKK